MAPTDLLDRIFVVRLCRARLVTHKPMCLIVASEPGLWGRININADRSFVNTSYRHELQTQFPPSRIELWNAPQFRLPSLHSVLIKAGARNPIATIARTISGHSATNQKEIFQSEFLGVGFLFMSFYQAFKDRHFRKFPTIGGPRITRINRMDEEFRLLARPDLAGLFATEPKNDHDDDRTMHMASVS
jgi:hypothetical protein